MPPTPTEVLDRWKTYLEEMRADTGWTLRNQELDQQRLEALREMRELIGKYLQGEINTAGFSQTFQYKAAAEWEAFGLKGMNGAMFLNKLVRHITDENRLALKLRAALKTPQSPDEARTAMRTLAAYLEEQVGKGVVTRSELQPARHAVFLSAWHNSSDKGAPPATFGPGDGQAPQPSAAAAANAASGSVEPAVPDIVEPEPGGEAAQSAHAQAQWALAKIGRKFNCKVWIAPNDRQQNWNNETLGALSISKLPWLGMDEQSQGLSR